MEKTIVKPLRGNLYLLNENRSNTCYLLVGSRKAALIDTMMGEDDLSRIAARYTSLPIIVLNTHGHSDHIGGDVYFDRAYLNRADMPLVDALLNEPEVKDYLSKAGLSLPRFEDVREGDVFDLGGVCLESFALPGHTAGGMVFLDRASGVLFTGDSINRHTWMQLDHCLPMTEFCSNLEKLKRIWPDVKYVAHGHARDLEPASLPEAHLNAVREVVDGMTDGDGDYTYFGGTVKSHTYSGGGIQIIYDPARPVNA